MPFSAIVPACSRYDSAALISRSARSRISGTRSAGVAPSAAGSPVSARNSHTVRWSSALPSGVCMLESVAAAISLALLASSVAVAATCCATAAPCSATCWAAAAACPAAAEAEATAVLATSESDEKVELSNMEEPHMMPEAGHRCPRLG